MPLGLAAGESGTTRRTRRGSTDRTTGNGPIRFDAGAPASATELGDGPVESTLAMLAAEISSRCRAAFSPAKAFEMIASIFVLQLAVEHSNTCGATISIRSI